MEVYVYKGEWGLPSIDFDCLRVLMFIKLTDAPVEIKISNGVIWSPNGLLPYLQHNGTKIAGYQKIIHHLNNQGYNLDGNDSKFETATDIDEGFVRLSLLPYFQYILWSPQNIDMTRALYARRIQFPLNFYTPKKYLERAENTMRQICNFSFDDPIAKHEIAEIASKAKQCLNLLEERLKPNAWLSGNEPGLVDCHIYAFCAILLNHSVPNNSLQIHLQQCPKLTSYVHRITKKYFEKEGFNSTKKDSSEKSSSSSNEKKFYTGEEQEEDPRQKRKRIIISAIVATISMVSYALFKGILAVTYDDEEAPDFLDYEDEGGEGDDTGE